MNIFYFLNELDKSGNFKLADKIDTEIRKVYAQAIRQTPGAQGNQMLDPNFAFILNQLLLKEQSKMTKTKPDTETLSPTKNTDVATLRKQVNNILSNQTIDRKKLKELETNFGTIPSIESKIGKVSDVTDGFDQKITNNTNDITQNTEDIMLLKDSVDTLK